MANKKEKPIAYLIHTFPLYSLTFIVDEIALMRGLGAKIDLFGIRQPSSDEYPKHYARYAKETHYVLPIQFFKHLNNHLRVLFTRPVAYFSCVKYALTTSDISLAQKVKLVAYFCEAIELSSLLTTDKYTHLHVHFLFGGAIVALFLKRLTGLSFSVTGHGTDFMVERFLLSDKVNSAEFVRVATQFNVQVLSDSIIPEGWGKLFQLPFGMNVSKAKEQKHLIQSRIKLERPAVIRILNVGRLVWQKGQLFLIEAAKRLKDRGVDFRLDIIGEGELREELEASILRYGLNQHIILHGALAHEEVFQKMQSADIFAFSSVSEGFGMVLLEAMASGLAIVASDINGVSEIIINGESGVLVPSKDTVALADAIERLCQDDALCQRLALKALDQVVIRFDNKVLVEKLYLKMQECFQS